MRTTNQPKTGARRHRARIAWTSLFLTAVFLMTLASPLLAQQDDPAARLLARMSPAARVGQLFLVTFPGTDLSEASAIYELILQEQIGGVILRAENDNIINEGDTVGQVVALTNGLQQLAWQAAQSPQPAAPGEPAPPPGPFVPLWIAVEQSGDTNPYTAITNGTTPLPSLMAIGATWNLTHAQTVGTIVGRELSALGINMLLGPSLDVLNTPRPGSAADLGVRSFGGDPYWVGRMGVAYVRGVHTGSNGRVAVIPGHFPGLGAADRPLSEEVSTVQKSLEQLKQIELAPFFAVASSGDATAQADGFLVSHIRYRGFQGNIYASTKPVSFDPVALQQLMNLPELAPWRSAGGVTVADELGVRAVRRFYDPTEQEFNGLRIAREAFLAGNDLLILSHFALGDDWESHFANIRAVLAFFRDKYASDPTFQARVDEAVLRILRLKLRLYGTSTPTLPGTQVSAEQATSLVGQATEQVAPIARDAATLLSPLSADLRPAPPAADEYIVIFTDDRQTSPCAGCTPTYVIPPRLMQETLIRLYGPRATSQVQPGRVSSFTFSELIAYLNTPPAATTEITPTTPSALETALEQADWVLFAMLDVSSRTPQSDAVRRFLAERPNLLRGKNVVVFAFAAPYYLDTTEISKLSAYFGLYSPTPPFVEAAVRALFDEFPVTGASPVSVAGINYEMIVQTQPNPAQTIQLYYEVVSGPPGEATPSPATPQPIDKGDTVRLWTSAIVDRNGHPVPDGTPVEFIFTYPQEGLEHSVQVTTRDGIAETAITLDRVGQLQISVRAEPVPRAVRLEMDIREGEPAVIIPINPTPTITPTATLPPTPPPTPEATPTPATQASPVGTGGRDRVRWGDFVLGVVSTALAAAFGYILQWRRQQPAARALRTGLWCVVGGLVAYICLALGLPGLSWVHERAGGWAVVMLALIGAAVPLTITLIRETVRAEG